MCRQSLDRKTLRNYGRYRTADDVFQPGEKHFGPVSKDGPDKNIYTESERLNLRCRTLAWFGRVNLYNRQAIIIPR